MPEKVITPDQLAHAGANSKNVLNGDVEIKGNIKFAGELMFDGKLDGDVQTDGVLNVGENASITGNINAQSVFARGKINGNISAKDKVEIKSRSELFGDIRAAKLVIEEGVTFVGKIEVNPNKVSPGANLGRGPESPRLPEPGKPPVR
jgi:cytoskeletal protein CcmA (bactofilin family)